jgi:adenylate cyclase
VLNLISRFLRYIGVISIILFCVASIVFSFLERQIPEGYEYKKYIKYASFFEDRFYDFRMQDTLKTDIKNDDVILLKVDDESLQTLGSWPVDRMTWSKMLDNLKSYGAKVVAFDVIFPEGVKTCGESSPDDSFANSISSFQAKEGNKVIMAYTTQDENSYGEFYDEMPEELYNYIIDSQQSNDEIGLVPRKVEKHTYPIQKLLNPGPELGYINMLEDTDGVFRHYQIVGNVDGMLYLPSIGLKILEAYTGESHKLEINNQGNASMKFKGKEIFINNKGETKIRWIGSEGKFKDISLHTVVNSKPDDEKLKAFFNNKIVFVGSTATGAHDLRNSPVDSKMPGVYAHMNMIHQLQHGYFYQKLDDSIKYSFYLLGFGLIILLGIMFFNKAILDLTTVVLLSAAVYFIDYNYFLFEGYELKLFFIMFTFIATYSWITFLNFNQANAEKKQIKGAFSRYVAPSIVDDMLTNPDKLKVGGERRDITCMFSDVRDFTSISEKLSPTQLASSLNRYMGEMTDIVFATNGTLDKYIGDAIVAFWGAPLDIGDHVTQAVDAGVKMMEALPAINDEFREKGLPEFKIGLGLNSGECNVGNMGSDQIFAYTALGDTMNLGARLESSCKYYGAQILISEYTYARLEEGRFVTRLIDYVRVKGKTQPVSVYEVLYSYHSFMMDPEALEQFKIAYQLFIDAKFEQALEIFKALNTKYPDDKSSNRLKESCQHWIANPPQEGEDHTITTRTDK